MRNSNSPGLNLEFLDVGVEGEAIVQTDEVAILAIWSRAFIAERWIVLVAGEGHELRSALMTDISGSGQGGKSGKEKGEDLHGYYSVLLRMV